MQKQATSVDVHVGSRIRARRAILNMSQEKLGQLLGLTFQQVQKYEKGVNRIGAGRLFEMARVLGVSIPYFYEGIAGENNRREYGFAEDEAPAPLQANSDVAELNAAFARITDPKVRKRILDLVKELAGEVPKRSRRKS